MEILKFILSIAGFLLFLYMGTYSFYLLVFSIAGRLIKAPTPPVSQKLTRFIIYICAYKEDEILLSSAPAALSINYPTELFDVCVIADSIKAETVEKLKEMPLQVLEVKFNSSTKCRALQKAIENTTEGFDAAVIFDIDNIAAPDFLYRLNDYLQAGHQVVQGHRAAKNIDTPIAILDAISEESNNHLFRRSQQVFGFSASLIGSGIALEYNLFKQIMFRLNSVGGFDKEMGLLLALDRIKVAFADNALIYDEKVSNAAMFKTQRRRWLSAQVSLLYKYATSGFEELFKGNWDYVNQIYQLSELPRVMMLGFLPLMLLISCILPGIIPGWQWWLASTIGCYAAVLIAIPASFINKKLFGALLRLPVIFFTMFLLLFRLKGANKKFIHTKHIHTVDKCV
jgi:cellulose synthase/poly-beta-1,6-N-acetylglucosamine synthase-like glycosyltransferase